MYLMITIYKNLLEAFPKMPTSIFGQNKTLLSRAYLQKWNRFFDFQAMYETEQENARLN